MKDFYCERCRITLLTRTHYVLTGEKREDKILVCLDCYNLFAPDPLPTRYRPKEPLLFRG